MLPNGLLQRFWSLFFTRAHKCLQIDLWRASGSKFALREQIWSNQLLPERHDGSSVMGIQCDLVWPWMLHVVSCAALGLKSASRPAVRGDSLFCDSDLISFARSSEDSQCVRFTMGGGQEGWDITFVSDCEPWRAAGLVRKSGGISKRFASAADLSFYIYF